MTWAAVRRRWRRRPALRGSGCPSRACRTVRRRASWACSLTMSGSGAVEAAERFGVIDIALALAPRAIRLRGPSASSVSSSLCRNEKRPERTDAGGNFLKSASDELAELRLDRGVRLTRDRAGSRPTRRSHPPAGRGVRSTAVRCRERAVSRSSASSSTRSSRRFLRVGRSGRSPFRHMSSTRCLREPAQPDRARSGDA